MVISVFFYKFLPRIWRKAQAWWAEPKPSKSQDHSQPEDYQDIQESISIEQNKAFAQENPSLIDKSTQPKKKLKKTR